MLIRYLPRQSALVAEMNDGDPVWGYTEHLLADLWALLVKVNSGPKSGDVDHPTRQGMVSKARAKAKRELKALFMARKNDYANKP